MLRKNAMVNIDWSQDTWRFRWPGFCGDFTWPELKDYSWPLTRDTKVMTWITWQMILEGRCLNCKLPAMLHSYIDWLVVEPPLWKYQSKWIIFPSRGENRWNHHLVTSWAYHYATDVKILHKPTRKCRSRSSPVSLVIAAKGEKKREIL